MYSIVTTEFVSEKNELMKNPKKNKKKNKMDMTCPPPSPVRPVKINRSITYDNNMCKFSLQAKKDLHNIIKNAENAIKCLEIPNEDNIHNAKFNMKSIQIYIQDLQRNVNILFPEMYSLENVSKK